MPVRKIKQSYTVVTGAVSSAKNGDLTDFEGPLEWQFLILLEFDWDNEIKSFEVQPLKIFYGKSLRGRQYSYTPDVLVHYRDGRPPCLFEVKPRKYLKMNWTKLKPKLRAGIRYARSNGMRFKIVTDEEIFTPFLENARFFRQYKTEIPSNEEMGVLLRNLNENGTTTPNALLASVSEDIWKRAALIPALWHLVATRRIGVDIEEKVHMESKIWPVEEAKETIPWC